MASPKNILITGANSGIGLVATKMLCRKGHHVIMACRSKERAESAMAEVRKENPEAKVSFMELDLSNMASIRRFAEDFKQKAIPLHVLVNNAGLFYKMDDTVRHTTDDGFEMTIGTNNLGHFLLTNLLLDQLKKTAAEEGESRIVSVTSTLHNHQNPQMKSKHVVKAIDFDDFMLEKDGAYTGMQAYKDSKAGNILFTYSLAKKLEGTGVIVNCMCPGFIPRTGLSRHSGAATRFVLNYFLDGFLKLFKKITRSPEEGGASIEYLAIGDEVKGKTGGYYSYDKLGESSEETRDEDIQKKMWETCVKLVKLDQESLAA